MKVGADGGCSSIELVGVDAVGDVGEGLGIGFEAVEDVGASLETFGVDEGLDGVRVPGFIGVVFGNGGGGLFLVVEADGGSVGVFGVVHDQAGGSGEVCGVASERS